MANKNYCIIKRGNYYYIPVKARLNPYARDEQPSYLACLPNFFGGNKKDDETDDKGLSREVCEESQEKISIPEAGLDKQNLYWFENIRVDRRNHSITDTYKFYLVTVDAGEAFFEGDCCLLDMSVEEPERREMRCILKIALNDLNLSNVDEFLAVCKRKVQVVERELGDTLVNFNPDRSNEQNNTALIHWKTHEGTRNAFEALLIH